jgi:hypothetical protein
MTYNHKHGSTDRSQRRAKRVRPENKSLPKVTHTTKPKNHKKIEKVKAHHHNITYMDAIDYAADIEEPEYEHQGPQYRVVGYIQADGNFVPRRRFFGRYVWSIGLMDDFDNNFGPFSICSSE